MGSSKIRPHELPFDDNNIYVNYMWKSLYEFYLILLGIKFKKEELSKRKS